MGCACPSGPCMSINDGVVSAGQPVQFGMHVRVCPFMFQRSIIAIPTMTSGACMWRHPSRQQSNEVPLGRTVSPVAVAMTPGPANGGPSAAACSSAWNRIMVAEGNEKGALASMIMWQVLLNECFESPEWHGLCRSTNDEDVGAATRAGRDACAHLFIYVPNACGGIPHGSKVMRNCWMYMIAWSHLGRLR